LPDLKAVMSYLLSLDSKQLAGYGGMSKAALGVLNRKLVELEQQGADVFLGEPEVDIHDLLRVTPDGKGIISILPLTDIQDRPAHFPALPTMTSKSNSRRWAMGRRSSRSSMRKVGPLLWWRHGCCRRIRSWAPWNTPTWKRQYGPDPCKANTPDRSTGSRRGR